MKKLFWPLILLFWAAATPARALEIPSEFDSVGPAISEFVTRDGRKAAFIDEGEKDWRTVVFFSGAGTSVQAFHLTEFNRSLRNNLKLRVVSLGRNGYGQTPYAAGLGFSDYASDLKELLESLGIREFVGVAISGGGPYMAYAAELMPEKVVSLHYAAAVSFPEAGQESRAVTCEKLRTDPAGFKKTMTGYIQNPILWWDLGKNTSINRIHGFQDAANNEGAHCFFIRGQMGDPAPVIHEYELYCHPGPKENTKVASPVFMYYGDADTTVTPVHADFWKQYYQKSRHTLRLYAGEGHDVQYRHWEQILIDMSGLEDSVLVCRNGKAELHPSETASHLVNTNAATLGSCAWATRQ